MSRKHKNMNDKEIECDWDEEYMKEYNERKPIIEQRRQEMMDKFRPKNKRD